MSLNVGKEFIKFKKNELTKYASISLGKKFNKQIFETLLDEYINIRYYNIDNNMSMKKAIDILNRKLIKLAKSLIDGNEQEVDFVLNFFGYIYYLDDVFGDFKYSKIVSEINGFRKNRLKLDVINEQDLISLIDSSKSRIEEFFFEFNSTNFSLNVRDTNIRDCYDINLDYDLKIPKLYSEYAINKVYNSGIVSENKLFIIYYMICKKIIYDTIDLNYKNNYLIPLDIELLKKKEKLNRLFNIIDNDMIKDRAIIKIDYANYVENKSLINDFISNGYKFSIDLGNDFIYSEENEILLNLFSYVVVHDENLAKRIGEIDKVIIS